MARVRLISGGVTAAKGFVASGVSAGIKRSRKPDLSLVVSQAPSTAAGVMTRNQVKAAPVLISNERLRGGRAQAVLLNSGCANCMTGDTGRRDALKLGHLVAKGLGLRDEAVLLASTGLIGRRLPVPRIARAVPALLQSLSRAHHQAAAQAILTTDLAPKETAVEARIGGRIVRVGGMAKGAGMIAPSMATMLCVITTDAKVPAGLLRQLLAVASDRTFNRITVDGDMSTNDCVYALANGASGVEIHSHASTTTFLAMLEAVCQRLAEAIVEDGEGASRIMALRVVGARTDREADACARQIANSPLVKTMLAGGDPNVGRIAAAAGASSAVFDANRLEIRIGKQLVVKGGVALKVGTAALRTMLQHPRVDVEVDLNAGRSASFMLTCDLTVRYVQINAGYAS